MSEPSLHLSGFPDRKLAFLIKIGVLSDVDAMSGKGGTPMTKGAAARVQAAEAKQGGGGVEPGGFAARAQVSCVFPLPMQSSCC